MKLNWLGSTNRETQVTYVWHAAPIQKLDDIKTTEIVVGSQAPGSTQYDFPMLGERIFGMKFKVITGYESTPKIHLAMERGEVQGTGANWSTLKAIGGRLDHGQEDQILAQWALKKHPELADVPIVPRHREDRARPAALQLALARLEYGRPFFLPPNVPAERVEAMRRAFDATMKDPAYLAEAEKLKIEVDAAHRRAGRGPGRAGLPHAARDGRPRARRDGRAGSSPALQNRLPLAADLGYERHPARPPYPEIAMDSRRLPKAARTTRRASKTTPWCAARPLRRRRPAARAGLSRYFVRSPHAFARIRVDRHRQPPRRCQGVLAVLTGADMEAAGVGNVGRHPPLAGRGGKKLIMPHRPALARERVHAYRRAGRDGGRRDARRRAGRRRTGRGRIRGAARRWSTCATRSSRARRKSGRRRPATSRSTGPALAADPDANARGGRARSSPPPSTSRASR